MCGIAGYVTDKPYTADPKLVQSMIETIRHRGPDGIGVHRDPLAGLGHARLSIIDLSGGRQPITNEDGTLWIVFNGEIFNYVELAQSMVEKGHILATRSDTEVIIHLYEEYGEDCVHHMNGQWAFAIWDSKRHELFLSRDRMGVRPLFYTRAAGIFLFGSEIKTLFTHPDVSRRFDVRALDDIFTMWCTLPPRTAFQNVHELPPGHSMRVRGGTLTTFQYWSIDYPAASEQEESKRTEEDYADELLSLLVDSTRLRLRSDVPVGAYLSGGLDSTITTALIRQFTNNRLRTFSVAFEDQEYDERAFQQEAAGFLGTDHSSVCCSDTDIGDAFPQVIWHAEQPIIRTAPAPLLLLSRLVRESGFKVVITGEGSDEMFGGYDLFKEAKIRRFCLAQPESRLRPLLLRKLYPYMSNIQAQPTSYLRAFFDINPGTASGPLFSHQPRWNLTSRNKLFFSEAVKAELRGRNIFADVEAELPAGASGWDPFCQAQYLEARYLLPGYILSSQGDRMAMANGVEGRYPFLDYRVAQFAAKLPPRFKMKVLNEKYLLKRTFGSMIPPSIRKRPKQPYRAPEARCLFTAKVREYVEELVSPERIRNDNLFDPRAVTRLVEKVRSNQAIGVKDNMALVGIVSTQMVLDQFIHQFPKRQNAEHRPALTSVR